MYINDTLQKALLSVFLLLPAHAMDAAAQYAISIRSQSEHNSSKKPASSSLSSSSLPTPALVAAEPSNNEILKQRAFELFSQSSYPEAASALSILIQSIGSDQKDLRNEALTLRAKAYLVLDQPTLALSDLSQVEYHPREVSRIGENKLLTGVAELQLKYYQKSINSFSVAQKLIPGTADVYSNRAVAYQAIGKYDLAIKDLQKSILIRPAVSSYFNMAILAKESGDYPACLEILNQIISTQPDYPLVFVQRGICAAKLGKHDQSIADMLKVLKVDPSNPDALQQMGISLVEKGQFEGGKKYLEKAASQRLILGQPEKYQEIVAILAGLRSK